MARAHFQLFARHKANKEILGVLDYEGGVIYLVSRDQWDNSAGAYDAERVTASGYPAGMFDFVRPGTTGEADVTGATSTIDWTDITKHVATSWPDESGSAE